MDFEVDVENPLLPYVRQWLNVLHVARRAKADFDEHAAEAMAFYTGDHSKLWHPESVRKFVEGGDLPNPDFRVQINKTYEAVSVYGPSLYYANPHRQVTPRRPIQFPIELLGDPNDPYVQQQYYMLMMAQQQESAVAETRAALLQPYLNYTARELHLKSHVRRTIDEAIIKGMGVMWTELWRPPGSDIRLVGSFWENIDNLLIDGDMDTVEDAMWIARRCVHPVWKVEREYGLPPGSLKGNLQSLHSEGAHKGTTNEKHLRHLGQTNDLLEYWKIYSRMGMGDHMADMPANLRGTLDHLGPFVYLVIANGVSFPLNLPPHLQREGSEEEIFAAVQWPTPFWYDAKWPFTELKWRDVPGELYPMGLMRPAMGELKAINWIASMLLGKLRMTSRDFIAVLAAAAPKVKQAIAEGRDLTVMELEAAAGTDISKIVQFIQHPTMNADIWSVFSLFSGLFDKRTGLTEVFYGLNPGGTQSRTATDAQIKEQGASIRPDDMANQVEDFATRLARQEAIAARWHLTGDDVRLVLGNVGAHLWDQYVATAPLESIARETEYTIAAGSARKPNKQRDMENMSQAMQVLAGVFQAHYAQTGDPGPLNTLIEKWGGSMDMDTRGMLLAPPPPPPSIPPADTPQPLAA